MTSRLRPAASRIDAKSRIVAITGQANGNRTGWRRYADAVNDAVGHFFNQLHPFTAASPEVYVDWQRRVGQDERGHIRTSSCYSASTSWRITTIGEPGTTHTR